MALLKTNRWAKVLRVLITVFPVLSAQAAIPALGADATEPGQTDYDIHVVCTTAGQLCEPPFSQSIETGGLLQVKFFVNPMTCSSMRLHVGLDGLERLTTPFLGWFGATGKFAQLPLETELLDLGPVTPGAHALTLRGEGQPGGCNTGIRLASWGGTLRALTSPPVTPTVSIVVGTGSGAPGGRARLPVVLDAAGRPVAGVQNDIAFDQRARIAATADAHPDCAVNPGIHKSASSFGFLPGGCTPGVTCVKVRAVVAAADNVDAIPPGSQLYTCGVTIARDAAVGSSFPLVCSGAAATDPEGILVPATCTDGSVSITRPCTGDCDGSGNVLVNEIILTVRIALGEMPLSACTAGDADGSGDITINEILAAVNNALYGCAS